MSTILFVSRGELLELRDCRDERPRSFLEKYLLRKMSGRCVLRVPDLNIEIQLLIAEGVVKACRGFDERGNLLEGNECYNLFSRFLDEERCILEMYSLPSQALELELEMFPRAVVVVEERVVVEEKPAEVVTRPAPPPPSIEVLRGIAEQCVDPTKMLEILRSTKTMFRYANIASFEDLVRTLLTVFENNPDARGIYAKVVWNHAYARLVIDRGEGRTYVEYGAEGAQPICGPQAFESLRNAQHYKEVFIWLY